MPEEGQSFDDFLSAELAGSGGDTSTETPAEAPAGPQPEEQPADTAPAEDATGDEALFDPAVLQQNPQLQPYAKQLQADYTRKMQSLAEERRKLEGIPEGTLQWARQLEEVAAVSPQAAAQMLQEAQARLLEAGAAQPEPEVYEDDDLWTDNERQLAQQNRALEQRLARIEQQSELARAQAQVDQQFSGLETELGVTIPPAERWAFLREMASEGIPITALAKVWRGTKGHEHTLRRGREEGEKALRARQALPSAPSGLASREPSGKPSPVGMDLGDYLYQELAGQ